jgi:cysteine desulfuration protein SufE
MTEIEDVLGSFELLGDWEQRYQYLVELGEHLEPMPDRYQVEANRVKGCMIQVWVRAYRDPQNPELIRYLGDCDTAVIKGVVALLVELLSGRQAKAIADMDLDGFFQELNLAEHLSPSRHFGVYAIVELMKQQAAELDSPVNQVA